MRFAPEWRYGAVVFALMLLAGLLFSGVFSLIVGLIIMVGWPGTASWAIGLLMGANFLSSGLSLVVFGRTINTTN